MYGKRLEKQIRRPIGSLSNRARPKTEWDAAKSPLGADELIADKIVANELLANELVADTPSPEETWPAPLSPPEFHTSPAPPTLELPALNPHYMVMPTAFVNATHQDLRTMQGNLGECWVDLRSGSFFGLCRHGKYWIWNTETLYGAECHEQRCRMDCMGPTECDNAILEEAHRRYPNAMRII